MQMLDSEFVYARVISAAVTWEKQQSREKGGATGEECVRTRGQGVAERD
jgi:hypothetical protein